MFRKNINEQQQKIRAERGEYLRIIREAEEKGIYVPGKSRKTHDRKYNEPYGMNCWGLSLKKRAEYATRKLNELKERSE